MSVPHALRAGRFDVTSDVLAAAGTTSDGFPWIWVFVIGAAVVVAALVLLGTATSVGGRRRRQAWSEDAARFVHDGLVIVDLSEPCGSPTSCGLETLVQIEDRLDAFLRRAGRIRTSAPSIRARELVENLSHSGSAFAAAVAAERTLREGVTARSAQQQAQSTRRVVERMHEFDLNLREFSWQLDEMP